MAMESPGDRAYSSSVDGPTVREMEFGMNARLATVVTWGGGGLILAAGVLAFALQILQGESVFAARLLAGLAGCL